MKFPILTLLFLCTLSAVNSIAQVDSTQINGKYYKVYPIRHRMQIQEEYWIGIDDDAYLQDPENYFNVFGESEFFSRTAFDTASFLEKGWLLEDLDSRWETLTKKRKGMRRKFAKAVRKNPGALMDPSFGMDMDLLPAFSALPDGNYVQLYNDFCLLNEDGECVPQTPRVAVYFQMKNNLLHGPATWVNVNGDTLRTGEYTDGLRSGTWKFTEISTYSYYLYLWEAKRFAKTGLRPMDTSLYTINYKAGVQDGAYLSSDVRGNNRTTGFYTNGERSGNWQIYYGNELTVNFTYAATDDTVLTHKPLIRTGTALEDFFGWEQEFNVTGNNYRIPAIPNDLLEFNFGNEENLDLEEEEFQSHELEYDTYGGERLDRIQGYNNYDPYTRLYPARISDRIYVTLPGYQNVAPGLFDFIYDPNRKLRETRGFFLDSLGGRMVYDGLFELYYPNGQLFMRYNFVNGELEKEDTLFWDNGQAYDVIEFLADSNQYMRKVFDYDGLHMNTAYYDSLGDFLRYDVEEVEYPDPDSIHVDGITAYKNFLGANDYYNDYYYNRSRKRYGKLGEIMDGNYAYRNFSVSQDSIIPDTATIFYKEYSGFDKHANLRSVTFDPATRTFRQEAHSYTGVNYRSANRVYTENYNGWTGKSIWKYGRFTVIETESGIWRQNPLEPEEDTVYRMRRIINPYSGYYVTTDVEILRDGQPYTGDVVVKNKAFFPRYSEDELKARQNSSNNTRKMANRLYRYFKKGKKHRTLDLISGPSDLGYVSLKISSNLYQTANESWFNAFNNSFSYYSTGEIHPDVVKGQIFEGKPQGYWYGKVGRDLSGEIQFERGEAFGTHKQYGYEYKASTWKRMQSEDSLPSRDVYYLNATTEYENGMRNGDFRDYNWYGEVEEQGTYKDDFREGEFIDRQSNAYSVTQFKNGYLDGYAQTYLTFPDMDTILLYDLNFQDGGLSGESNTYHTNGKLAKRGFFLNGKPIEDYEAYDTLGFKYHYVKFQYGFPIEEKIWEENQLSLRYKFDWEDSIYFDPSDLMQSQSLDRLLSEYGYNDYELKQAYYGRNRLVNKDGLDYHMTKFYPNDTIARSGRIIDGKKVGLWKFYDYEGLYLYKVNYFDSIITINDSIRYKSKGVLTRFNAAGDSTFRAHIIEKMEKYDCAHTDHYEIRQLYTIWEKDASVGRINGYVQNFYDNGVLQNEGEMKDGKPTGLWKYYDPFGKLNLMGTFEQGKRDGRWLQGDLEKKKYLGEICLNPNLPNLEDQKKYRENLLDVTIINYRLGKTINKQFFDLDLNKYSDLIHE